MNDEDAFGEELMPCWSVEANQVGLCCVHAPFFAVHYALQQVQNGWILVMSDAHSGIPAAMFILPDIEQTHVARAQRIAHDLMDVQIEVMNAVLTFYDEHSPLILTQMWHGPDAMGGYGRVVNGALFLINGVVYPDAQGNYVMTRIPLHGHKFTPNEEGAALRMIEGGDLEDVQRRALVIAQEWPTR